MGWLSKGFKAVKGAVTGKLGSSLLGAGLEFLGGQSLQDDSQKHAIELAKHGVSYRMQDLKDAGLNPILAANMGFGGSPTPGGSGAGMPNVAGSVNSALNSKKLEAELDLLKQQKFTSQKEAYRAEAAGILSSRQADKTNIEKAKLMRDQPLWEQDWAFHNSREGRELRDFQRYIESGKITTGKGLFDFIRNTQNPSDRKQRKQSPRLRAR